VKAFTDASQLHRYPVKQCNIVVKIWEPWQALAKQYCRACPATVNETDSVSLISVHASRGKHNAGHEAENSMRNISPCFIAALRAGKNFTDHIFHFGNNFPQERATSSF